MSEGDPSAHETVTLDLRYPIWKRVFTVSYPGPDQVVGCYSQVSRSHPFPFPAGFQR